MAIERFAKIFKLKKEKAQILFYVNEAEDEKGACVNIMTLKQGIYISTQVTFSSKLTEDEKYKQAYLMLDKTDKKKAKGLYEELTGFLKEK